jgi:RNA polymerase sigma factor (sigma-70 family)
MNHQLPPDPEFEDAVPVSMKDWTAQDFSNLYVRYRPTVLAHVKKVLVNPDQAEEVTQDTFFYLMTALPEVDSEFGVLRLLKWKSRMLALNLVARESRISQAPLDESTSSFEAEIPEPSEAIVRADDAAIVAQALAKIPPLQRRALVMSLYEEQTYAQMAETLEVTPNAVRQMVFRAKGSFRKALIGEAAAEGLSVSEILSLAARRAAANSGKFIGAAGVMVLVAAVSFGFMPQSPSDQRASEPSLVIQEEVGDLGISSDSGAGEEEVPAPSSLATEPETQAPSIEPSESVALAETVSISNFETELAEGASTAEVAQAPFPAQLQTGLVTSSLSVRQVTHPLGTPAGQVAVSFDFGPDLQMFANYDPGTNVLVSPVLVAEVDGQQLIGIPKLSAAEVVDAGGGLSELKVSIQDFYTEVDGAALNYSWITDASSSLTLTTNGKSSIVRGEALLNG